MISRPAGETRRTRLFCRWRAPLPLLAKSLDLPRGVAQTPHCTLVPALMNVHAEHAHPEFFRAFSRSCR
jgi:hypothetical protein